MPPSCEARATARGSTTSTLASADATPCEFADTDCNCDRNLPADEPYFTAEHSVSRQLAKVSPAHSKSARVYAFIEPLRSDSSGTACSRSPRRMTTGRRSRLKVQKAVGVRPAPAVHMHPTEARPAESG
jgi:hypothetical protein